MPMPPAENKSPAVVVRDLGVPCWCAPPLQECHISKQGIHSIIHRKSITVTESVSQ